MKLKAEIGWTLFVVYVWLWNKYATEGLSQGFWRGLEHPESRLILIFVWGWVSSHLLFKRPRRILVKW